MLLAVPVREVDGGINRVLLERGKNQGGPAQSVVAGLGSPTTAVESIPIDERHAAQGNIELVLS